MEQKISEALEGTHFLSKYRGLCNLYHKIDQGINFKKKDLTDIISALNLDLKYSSKEKIFYQDYLFNDINLRYILSYKYGFIDCTYVFWNDDNSFRKSGSFSKFCKMVDKSFEDSIPFKFPIATSISDLESIMSELFDLNILFVSHLQKSLSYQA